MSRLKQLIHEIHRRSLWQVLGIYSVGAWLVFQIAQTFTEGLGLPDWVPPLALLLLLVGLPVVVATAFVQEGIGSRARTRPAIEPVAVEPLPTEQATPPLGVHEEAKSVIPRRLLTWRNLTVGGVLAFALLGLVTAGYMANAWIRMRHPDYDELRRMLNRTGETVKVRAE